jgi:hypothetical protein
VKGLKFSPYKPNTPLVLFFKKNLLFNVRAYDAEVRRLSAIGSDVEVRSILKTLEVLFVDSV